MSQNLYVPMMRLPAKRAIIAVICSAFWILGMRQGSLALVSKPQAKTAKKPVPNQRKSGAQTAKSGAFRAAEAIHIVKPGDTLYSLAREHSTTVQALMAANNLRSNKLRIGQRLLLSAQSGAAQSVGEQARKTPLPEWKKTDAPNPFSLAALKSAISASEIITLQHAQPLGYSAPDQDINDEDPDPPPTLRFRLVTAGLDYLGVRYRWNGLSEKTGFDCSGLVKRLFDRFGISLPRSAREQYKLGVEVSPNDMQVGDLVFFSARNRIPTHVGIYIGENCILHAMSGARKVIVSHLEHSWYKRRFLGARRIQALWAGDPSNAEAIADAEGTH